jgi:hypothetical protein
VRDAIRKYLKRRFLPRMTAHPTAWTPVLRSTPRRHPPSDPPPEALPVLRPTSDGGRRAGAEQRTGSSGASAFRSLAEDRSATAEGGWEMDDEG